MKTIGFELKKGELRSTVLRGTVDRPEFVRRDRRLFDPDLDPPALMNWFKQNFSELLREEVDRMGYRISTSANSIDQISYLHLPWGILNLLAFELGKQICVLHARSFTARRLGLERGTKPENVIDDFIGSHPPHWDGAQRNSALVAWVLLGEG